MLISNITEWLNTNSGALMVISAFLLAGITWWYVHLTRQLLKVTHKPEILVYLCPSETYFNCINLCVQNVGTGLARDVKFTGNLSFSPDNDLRLGEIGFIKKGIDYLGPGQKIEHFLRSVYIL